jgi:hypothetical protein
MSETTDNSQAGGRCAPAPGSAGVIRRPAWHNGTPVYWHRRNGDTVPAVVMGVNSHGWVLIEADRVEGTRLVRVPACRLERQNTQAEP